MRIRNVEECPNALRCDGCPYIDKCNLYPVSERERKLQGQLQCAVYGPVSKARCQRCGEALGRCLAETGKVVYRRIPNLNGCEEDGVPMIRGSVPDCCAENMDLYTRLVCEGDQGMQCVLGCHIIYVERGMPGDIMILELFKKQPPRGTDLRNKNCCCR